MSDFNFDFSLGALARPIIGALTGYAQGGGPAYSPTSLFSAGEQGVWYDPSDFSTMFQDAARTTPVTTVGQPVGAINDKSGRGNHVTQATAGKRPVLQQNGAGKYYLQFDGVDDALATAAINLTATNTVSLIVGSDSAASSAAIFAELSTAATANNGSFYITSNEWSDALGTFRVRGTTTTGGGNATVYAQPRFAVSSFVLKATTNPTVIARANGVDVGITDNGSTTPANFGTWPLYIGGRGGASLFYNGRLYQLIVRGALTSGTALTNTETYVNSKTGAY